MTERNGLRALLAFPMLECSNFSSHLLAKPSLQQNEIGTLEVDPFRISILDPWPPL